MSNSSVPMVTVSLWPFPAIISQTVLVEQMKQTAHGHVHVHHTQPVHGLTASVCMVFINVRLVVVFLWILYVMAL